MIDKVFAVAAVMIVMMLCMSFTYSCSISTKNYYSLAGQCISSGGTFIPNGGGWNAMCIGIDK